MKSAKQVVLWSALLPKPSGGTLQLYQAWSKAAVKPYGGISSPSDNISNYSTSRMLGFMLRGTKPNYLGPYFNSVETVFTIIWRFVDRLITLSIFWEKPADCERADLNILHESFKRTTLARILFATKGWRGILNTHPVETTVNDNRTNISKNMV